MLSPWWGPTLCRVNVLAIGNQNCQDPCIVTFEFFMNNLMFSYRCKKTKKRMMLSLFITDRGRKVVYGYCTTYLRALLSDI